MAVSNGSTADILTGVLACPSCGNDLEKSAAGYLCLQCGKHFGIEGGIALFAEPQVRETSANQSEVHNDSYAAEYQDPQDAQRYADSFHKTWRKRRRTRRELEILETLLADLPRCHTILDVPCGGGRLSGPIAARTEHLLEADISQAQVQLALSQSTDLRRGLTVSALTLPFESGSLDAVISPRLAHHFASASDRERLLSELLRVSRKFVIFSFNDRNSIHTLSRKLRAKPINPCTMSVGEIRQIAKNNGARLTRILTVSLFGRRHRFALLLKP